MIEQEVWKLKKRLNRALKALEEIMATEQHFEFTDKDDYVQAWCCCYNIASAAISDDMKETTRREDGSST